MNSNAHSGPYTNGQRKQAIYEGAGFDKEHNLRYRIYYKVITPEDLEGDFGVIDTYAAANPAYFYDEVTGRVLPTPEGEDADPTLASVK